MKLINNYFVIFHISQTLIRVQENIDPLIHVNINYQLIRYLFVKISFQFLKINFKKRIIK